MTKTDNFLSSARGTGKELFDCIKKDHFVTRQRDRQCAESFLNVLQACYQQHFATSNKFLQDGNNKDLNGRNEELVLAD